jgi:Domain of unknown function (DUF1835)
VLSRTLQHSLVPVLHVTNGDSAIDRLRAAGFDDPALPWRDVLHDGPVPRGTDDALREVRARFIAERGWTTLEGARHDLALRDRTLHGALADRERELVLWFEHDLYDQLQLAQVLDVIARHPNRVARIRAIHADDYLGHATPDRLRSWHVMAHDLTEAELEAGRAAWDAFRAPDPRPLDVLACTTRTSALPFMRAALQRVVEELPGRTDGLARSERQVLGAVASGARTGAEAFDACAAMEKAIYLGDASFGWYLERLSTCRHPMLDRRLRGKEGDGTRSPDGPALARWELALTPEGERVHAGEADHMAMNGVARWLGGTLIDALSPWRCDDGGRVSRVEPT